MKITFDQTVVDITPQGKSYRATIGDKTVDVEIVRADAERGQLELLIDNQRITAYVSLRWPKALGDGERSNADVD